MICRLPQRIIKPELSPPTLRELLLDMTLITGVARNTSTTGTVGALGYTSLAVTAYCLSICNGYMGIWKAKSSGITTTPIKSMSNDYGGINVSGTAISYKNSGYGTAAGGDSVYGATLVLVRFPSYTEAQIDAVLGAMTLTRIAGRNSSSTGYVRTQDKTHDFYLTTRYKATGSSYTGSGTDPGLVIWECDGSTWTKLNQVTPDWQAGAVSSGYLTLGAGTYGASLIAID